MKLTDGLVVTFCYLFNNHFFYVFHSETEPTEERTPETLHQDVGAHLPVLDVPDGNAPTLSPSPRQLSLVSHHQSVVTSLGNEIN